jgi:hypothetical protein
MKAGVEQRPPSARLEKILELREDKLVGSTTLTNKLRRKSERKKDWMRTRRIL